MTSVISPTTYLYYCHHSHQHQYSFYSPTMSLTSSVSSLEKFQWKNHKVVCFYQPISKATNIRPKRSDVGSLPELPESPSNCLCRHHLNNINHLPQNSLGSAYCTHCAPMSAQLPAPTLHSTPWWPHRSPCASPHLPSGDPSQPSSSPSQTPGAPSGPTDPTEWKSHMIKLQ